MTTAGASKRALTDEGLWRRKQALQTFMTCFHASLSSSGSCSHSPCTRPPKIDDLAPFPRRGLLSLRGGGLLSTDIPVIDIHRNRSSKPRPRPSKTVESCKPAAPSPDFTTKSDYLQARFRHSYRSTQKLAKRARGPKRLTGLYMSASTGDLTMHGGLRTSGPDCLWH